MEETEQAIAETGSTDETSLALSIAARCRRACRRLLLRPGPRIGACAKPSRKLQPPVGRWLWRPQGPRKQPAAVGAPHPMLLLDPSESAVQRNRRGATRRSPTPRSPRSQRSTKSKKPSADKAPKPAANSARPRAGRFSISSNPGSKKRCRLFQADQWPRPSATPFTNGTALPVRQ